MNKRQKATGTFPETEGAGAVEESDNMDADELAVAEEVETDDEAECEGDAEGQTRRKRMMNKRKKATGTCPETEKGAEAVEEADNVDADELAVAEEVEMDDEAEGEADDEAVDETIYQPDELYVIANYDDAMIAEIEEGSSTCCIERDDPF